MKRGLVFGGIIVVAMIAFELFNYTTTDFALTNLLGDLSFVGLRWATILSIAFCFMDFAGIARLFTPGKERGEQVEVWYLLAAWFLAATMNAMLTWWAVSLALLNHTTLGNEILARETLLSVVPVFVAVLVWLIRILLIGMMSMAGDRLFAAAEAVVRHVERSVQATQAANEALPAAAFTSGSNGSTHSARMLGSQADDSRRPMTVAEKHGYGRNMPTRPVAPPPPPSNAVVRPAPKPTAVSNGNRAAVVRTSTSNGNSFRPADDDLDL